MQLNQQAKLQQFTAAKNNIRVEELLSLSNRSLELLQQTYLKVDEIKKTLASKSRSDLNKISVNALNFSEVRWMLQCYGIQATQYNSIGHQKRCEGSYVKYVQIIEQLYGKGSIEAANSYYHVGVYYFEQQLTNKATLCLQKALNIMQAVLGKQHVGCSDCLFNLGLIQKLQLNYSQAHTTFAECLQIRQEGIGAQSLQSAKVLEEIGKLYLEESKFVESFNSLKQCYTIYTKLNSSKSEDADRIAALLCFIHRKIELQISSLEKEHEIKGIKLSNSQAILQEVHYSSRGKLHDSFTWLDDAGFGGNVMKNMFKENLGGGAMNSAQIPNEQFYKLMSTDKANLQKQEIIAKSVADQQEKAIYNFQRLEAQQISQVSKSKKDYQLNAFNSETFINQLVDDGLASCAQIVNQAEFDHRLPYAIALLLSLSADQFKTLRQTQITVNNQDDPLYLSEEFIQTLDQIQSYLVFESKLWNIPKTKFLRQDGEPLQFKNIMIPEQKDRKGMRKRLQNDQKIILVVQQCPEFVQTLEQSQIRIFQHILVHNLLLKYFFICIMPKQRQIIQESIDQCEKEQGDLVELTRIFNTFEFMSKPTKPQSTETTKVFDYKIESFVMICAFDNLEDYQAIDPIQFGFDESYINSLTINSNLKRDLIAQMHEFTAVVNQDSVQSVDSGKLKDYIDLLLQTMSAKDAYYLYREIVRRFQLIQGQTQNGGQDADNKKGLMLEYLSDCSSQNLSGDSSLEEQDQHLNYDQFDAQPHKNTLNKHSKSIRQSLKVKRDTVTKQRMSLNTSGVNRSRTSTTFVSQSTKRASLMDFHLVTKKQTVPDLPEPQFSFNGMSSPQSLKKDLTSPTNQTPTISESELSSMSSNKIQEQVANIGINESSVRQINSIEELAEEDQTTDSLLRQEMQEMADLLN